MAQISLNPQGKKVNEQKDSRMSNLIFLNWTIYVSLGRKESSTDAELQRVGVNDLRLQQPDEKHVLESGADSRWISLPKKQTNRLGCFLF